MAMHSYPIIGETSSLLEQLDPAFSRGAYILHCGSLFLTQPFRSLISLLTVDGTIACYAPILDCLAADSLRYERPAGQRAFCMWLNVHPEGPPREVVVAAVIHEAAHYLTDKSSSRDEPDEAKAIRDWWNGAWGDREHSRDWARAAAHLAYRAMAFGGVRVAAADLLESYGPHEQFLGELRGELVSRAHEPIETILASGASSSQSSRRRQRPRWPKHVMMGGQIVAWHQDGSVEIFPDYDGRGAERYRSVQEFRDSLKGSRRRTVA